MIGFVVPQQPKAVYLLITVLSQFAKSTATNPVASKPLLVAGKP
jgi:hypothetical protein